MATMVGRIVIGLDVCYTHALVYLH